MRRASLTVAVLGGGVVLLLAASTAATSSGRMAQLAADLAVRSAASARAGTAGVVCGDRSGDGYVTATDALLVLQAAVALVACDPWICDVNASGSVTAADALMILRAAVGLGVVLTCPAAPTTTTTTTSTTTTTLYPSDCPFDAPLADFRKNCLPLVYVYDYPAEGLTEVFATDGTQIAFGQTDGVDTILYVGTVASQTSATLLAASFNQSPLVALGRGSTGVIRSAGYLLDITVKLGGKTYKFLGARYVETAVGAAVGSTGRMPGSGRNAPLQASRLAYPARLIARDRLLVTRDRPRASDPP